MITTETIEKLARQYQMSVFPNVVREYFQHVFLSKLYALPESERLLFKGGTALRIIYGSPRFSEDLDFSLSAVPPHETKKTVENFFIKVLADIEQVGIHVEISEKSNVTTGGYFGIATFRMPDYQPVDVEINISARRLLTLMPEHHARRLLTLMPEHHARRLLALTPEHHGRNSRDVRGEVDSVVCDFAPTYTIVHLPQQELVEEKIFGALRERKKPRDYYDLYFMMRRNMLSPEQKRKLTEVKNEIIAEAGKINFKSELGTFLPIDQQGIIRDFANTLAREMDRQLAST